MRPKPCPNYNHGRRDAPVRYCSNCGQVVNERILIQTCSEQKHAKERKRRNTFCVDCGEQLIK